ncbi:SapC family protein [Roseicella frigidaeris]|uniref:SapC family protein n=1 Tax=Roseicella frigidaeris TaxID=2230885 RepID=A0A327MGQ9_9PROT|nr:SapC family protein [Roseicella frigidaeris]RAI59368.1 hypothetical protein DOO78_10115 [Roseicella frigidaeris]
MPESRPPVNGAKSGATNGAGAAAPSLPILYRSLEVLAPERHARLRVREAGYAFAAGASAIPLMAEEFPVAARSLPIVFAAQPPHLPVALTGLVPGRSVFVTAAGQWRPGAYVPAYLRRFPFLLVRTGPETEERVLCVEPRAPQLSETEGAPLFDAAGQPTPQLRHVLGFARAVEEGSLRTRAMTERLHQLGLLKPAMLQVSRPGGPLRIDGFFAVDRPGLAALPAEAFLGLRAHGWLEAIHAHLLSLAGVAELARGLDRSAPGGLHRRM